MKHFIVEITYLVPIEVINQTVAEHRKYLSSGYDQSLILCSGPLNPKTGGIAIAKAPSSTDLKSFFENDPYNKKGVASYQFTEFEPVMFQPLLHEWLDNE